MTVAPVHLILGEEDFIGERIRRAILDELRADAPDLELTVMRANEVSAPELIDATSPSLFGEDRAVIITHTEVAGKEPNELLLATCRDRKSVV